MRIAMAQMAMGESIAENLNKSLEYIKECKGKADFLFFPELQLTPFYPLHKIEHWHKSRKELAFTFDSPEVKALRNTAKEVGIWISPNLYMDDSFTNPLSGITYPYYRDMSLMINPEGKIVETASMVHVLSVEDFWETDYYDPSDDGFKVVDTPHGKMGIVICYDRHLPESIRTCALKGAELIIIPTVNMKNEPMEMFMQELRVQAFQNNVFIAMCNRVGKQDHAEFAGESLIVNPEGEVIFKADDKEQLIIEEIELSEVKRTRNKRPYILTRREDSIYFDLRIKD